MLPFTLQQLRILKAIATEKNFTKAAELLYLSQPSLSKQIKTLEHNLGIRILNRENNKMEKFFYNMQNGFLHFVKKVVEL